MKTKKAVALTVLLTLAFFIMIIFIFFSATTFLGRTEPVSQENIAVVDIHGPIISGGGIDFMGTRQASAENIISLIREVKKDDHYQALVLNIDTPGGSAAASQAVFKELMRFREKTEKPVVASLADTAASGGYYIAAASDYIISNPATLTGSIGVIMELGNFQELFDMLGIEFEVLKGGEYKDIGHPGRSMTDEERLLLQNIIDEIYDHFIDAVVEGREMEREEVLQLATGELFTGSQALEMNLIDGLGNYTDALKRAEKMAGLKDPQVINISRVSYSFFDIIFNLRTEEGIISKLDYLIPIIHRIDPFNNIRIKYQAGLE